MSIPSLIPESQTTRSPTPSLIIRPASNLYSLVRPDVEIPPSELPTALSDQDSSSSSVVQQESQHEHRNETEHEHEHENENEQPVETVLIIPHREVLVPNLFSFSFEATPRQPSQSPPCSPLSRPVQLGTIPSTSTPITAPNPSTNTSTASTRSPLNFTIHLITYTLSSLNTIRHGIPNIQSTYFASSSISTSALSSSIKILFPHTTSFLKSLNRLISTLNHLFRRLESHSTSAPASNSPSTRFPNIFIFNYSRNRNHGQSRSPPLSPDLLLPLQRINEILTNLSTTVIEPIFEIFRFWHDCPCYGNDWYYKKKVILGMDLRFEGFGRRVREAEGEIRELKRRVLGSVLGMDVGVRVSVSWFCDWVRGLVGREAK